MDELTMVLDELESRPSGRMLDDSPPIQSRRLSQDGVQKLVNTLRLQGGDMARVASVIADLACDRADTDLSAHTAPTGNVRMPGSRSEMRTLTAGNGVMTCTDS